MSTTDVATVKAPRRADTSGMGRRLRALGRAELTLLMRNKAMLFVALATPVLLTVLMRQTISGMSLKGTGLSTGTVLIPGSIGYVLVFAVYANLTGIYVTRREELVLKRLRTGEASDGEILTGSALPSLVLALGQCVLLLGGGAAVLDLAPPERPELVAAGLLLGLVLMVLLAAVSAAFTRTTEASQITTFPFMAISFVGSGVVVPLDVMPDTLADVCSLLPVSPTMELVRNGWVGTLSGVDTAQALAVLVVWIVLGTLGVRRWFRWEPRR
ncbi:ABC transporter permease [Streptomyces winkii]|uniref:ABC transporter permease n=1 Tax=Streptomyces winkii TaxID=3051178 RepID=UPI0028D0C4D2|nr:ABC transporter permease [Streptomyces sp. DSM 40971]